MRVCGCNGKNIAIKIAQAGLQILGVIEAPIGFGSVGKERTYPKREISSTRYTFGIFYLPERQLRTFCAI
jgi:hypothetical protein